MASVHRPERESLLSLWLISQGKTTHGWPSSIKPVGGGQKREAMSPGSLAESGDHRELRLQWEEGG